MCCESQFVDHSSPLLSAQNLAGEEDSSDDNSQKASEDNKDESESEEDTVSSKEEDNQEEEIMPTKTPTKKSPKKSPTTTKRASASKTTKAKKKVTITDDVDDFDVTKMLGYMALDKNSPNFCLEIKEPWKRATFINTVSNIQFYNACVVNFLMAVSHIMSGLT